MKLIQYDDEKWVNRDMICRVWRESVPTKPEVKRWCFTTPDCNEDQGEYRVVNAKFTSGFRDAVF